MDNTVYIAAIAIGRNEGKRLRTCLVSLGQAARVIYVDSGSTDGSPALARELGAEVVDLDMSQPFTAARARNTGLEALRAAGTRPEFVIFIDGDCELQPGFVAEAMAKMQAEPRAAVVCGRRRERHPEASVYNAQCDREWDTPVGEALACGGDALMRMAALDEVGGYDPGLIAGEEPEMCVRLRGRGWSIWRIDAEMTLHDAAMTTFGQFWKRTRRAGHAFAEGAYMHGAAPEYHFVAETKRAAAWGLALPVVIVLLLLTAPALGILALLLYPVQIARLARRAGGDRAAWQNAALLTVGKLAEGQGVAEFHLRRLLGRRAGLIEYK